MLFTLQFCPSKGRDPSGQNAIQRPESQTDFVIECQISHLTKFLKFPDPVSASRKCESPPVSSWCLSGETDFEEEICMQEVPWRMTLWWWGGRASGGGGGKEAGPGRGRSWDNLSLGLRVSQGAPVLPFKAVTP